MQPAMRNRTKGDVEDAYVVDSSNRQNDETLRIRRSEVHGWYTVYQCKARITICLTL
jgi:hypothetical protein